MLSWVSDVSPCILCFQYSWKRFDRFCLFKKRKRFDRPRKSYKPRKYHWTVQIKCIEQCFKCMICLKSVFKCSRNAYIHAFAKCFQLIRPKFSLLIFSKIKSTTHSSRKTEIWNDWFSNDEIDLLFFLRSLTYATFYNRFVRDYNENKLQVNSKIWH